MNDKSVIRISVVSYLNSRPFIYGLNIGNTKHSFEISEDIPSVCGEKIKSGKADIGLIPVAILPELNGYEIISDYCIGANGNVSSVLLLSEVPLSNISTILLDYQSRTSVLLAKILGKEFWKINPEWKNASENFEKDILGSTAGVVIGDRALEMKDKFPFVYDLSGEWKKFTGLPFVFACWVSTKKLPVDFIKSFNAMLTKGLLQIDIIADKEKSDILSRESISKYLTESIDYNFDTGKKKALDVFLKQVAALT